MNFTKILDVIMRGVFDVKKYHRFQLGRTAFTLSDFMPIGHYKVSK